VDRDGKVVVRHTYDWAGDFTRGLARVRSGGRVGYIDRRGSVIWELKD
jgi:hypothetical protein